METTQKQELVKRIKSEISNEQIENNLRHVFNCIEDWIDDNKWQVLVDGNSVDTDYFEFIDLHYDFDRNTSKNGRKQIAKKIARVWSKPSRRTINTLLFVLRKREVIKQNVKINLSVKEQEIQNKRKIWKHLQAQSDKALLDYKKEKGDFYKKDLVESK